MRARTSFFGSGRLGLTGLPGLLTGLTGKVPHVEHGPTAARKARRMFRPPKNTGGTRNLHRESGPIGIQAEELRTTENEEEQH